MHFYSNSKLCGLRNSLRYIYIKMFLIIFLLIPSKVIKDNSEKVFIKGVLKKQLLACISYINASLSV